MSELITGCEIATAGHELSAETVEACADALVDESVANEEKGAFLEALAKKGETVGEIEAFVRAFLRHAVDPKVNADDFEEPLFDIVGTGGDKLNLFNVSTTAMFILAGAGVVPVKHANRAVTSKSGGADLMAALGVKIDLAPDRFAEVLKQTGVGFLFAQLYHPAFKAVGPVRQELSKRGVRTVFNLLGPHLNPVQPKRQLIGVCDPAMLDQFAAIMRGLGRDSGWVVCGSTNDGQSMDEISTVAKTEVRTFADGGDTVYKRFSAEDFGAPAGGDPLDALVGGTSDENAKITLGILSGDITGAPRRMVLANAAAGLCAAGVRNTIDAALVAATESLDSGRAMAKLKALVEATNR